MTSIIAVGPDPASLICPSCGVSIQTRIEHEANTKTHIIAILLCVFLCWPCICVPYCTNTCRNANHYCPSCNSYLGTYAA